MYTENKRPINRCQYWSTYEASPCTFWDKANTICTYSKEAQLADTSVIQRADFYPYCNYIGTAKSKCTQYAPIVPIDTSEPVVTIQPCCILPDPYRHLYMSPQCSKWVISEPPTSSGTLLPLDYSRINKYNEGNCNYIKGNNTTGGTEVTCSGFSPQHLGFGPTPTAEKCTLSGIELDKFLNTKKKLPFNYDILNKRSDLGRCSHWSNKKDYLFTITTPTISGTTVSGIITTSGISAMVPLTINAPIFSCNDTTGLATTFSGFYNDIENSYIRPPCNGAMPDCPRYTGNLASAGYLPFLSTVYLRNGDKIMAEQVLELRYNLQKETWNPAEYDSIFGKDASIYAHTGLSPEIVYDATNLNIVDYSLTSTKVSIKDFTCFTFDRKSVLLTAGTPSDNNKVSFDTLIQEIGDLFLEPLIRSMFDTVYDPNDTLSYEQKIQYIFETTKTDHKKILLVGDYFYDKTVFALNISDPDISFPFMALFDVGNMNSFKRSGISKRIFKEKHLALACYLKALKDIAPQKIYYNESSEDDRCFIINVDTFFGENKIIVFDTSNDIYTFDVITITKHFCGGIIAQTEFQITSPEESISYNENYEAYSFLPRYNPRITYEFKPLNTSTGAYTIPYTTYLDTRVTVPPANPIAGGNLTLFLGYSLYKIKALPRFFVSVCDTTSYSKLIFLGNAGKVLVVIDDSSKVGNVTTFKLHSVIRKWDTGEVDSSGNSKPMVLYLSGLDANGEHHSIEMEVVEHCTDRLEINQIILKPKRPNEYVRLYGPSIDFPEGLYIYEKYSYGKNPSDKGYSERDYTKIRDGWPEDNLAAEPPVTTTIMQDSSTLTGELTDGTYTITQLPTFPMVASVIFRGALTMRIRGQIKSDLLVWIKQPFCSDVEINYSWSATYKQYTVLPTGYCFIKDIGLAYKGTGIGGYTPNCGDHNFGRVSQRPSSMWYPYKACDEYASYNIYAGSGENDHAPMEFWLDSVGKPIVGKTPYGYYNLRMLGPSQNYGYTVDSSASIWACNCDYTHANSVMVGSPWFSGWARIRTGVEGEAYYYLTQNGGLPPKFGNKKRGYLLSFRSTAALYYYKVGDTGYFSREKKWLPAYEAFSDVSLSDSFKEYPWLHYFNLNDNSAIYMNQLGLSLVINDINGTTINEKLVYEDSTGIPGEEPKLKRYAFTEIFKAHYTTTGMLYPEPRKKYTIGDSAKPVTAWLTYKEYINNTLPPTTNDDGTGGGASVGWEADPTGEDTTPFPIDNTNKSIQWAWRELWKPIERDTPNIRQLLRDIDLAICSVGEFYTTYLSFIDIAYTNYTYNFYISEFRRIPTEGLHKVIWLPSIYDKENPLPTHFILRLDTGPWRILNSKCELITDVTNISSELQFKLGEESISMEDIIKHAKLYDMCKGLDWLNGVTDEMALEAEAEVLQIIGASTSFIVYDAETTVVETEDAAKENAKNAEREIEIIDDENKISHIYFNRGLILTINTGMLQYLPKKHIQIIGDFEFRLSSPTNDTSNFSTIVINDYYPPADFILFYDADLGDTSLSLDLGKTTTLTFKFDSKLIVSKIEVVYKTGIFVDDLTKPEEKQFYNIPGVELKKSSDDADFDSLLKTDYEFVTNTTEAYITKTYALPIDDLNFISELIKYFSIDFQYAPSLEDFDEEFEKSVYFKYLMQIQSIKLFTIQYTPVDEQIVIHERKFNISVGSYGTFPIHGTNSTGALLYPSPFELSTTYQYDDDTGMVGMPGSSENFTSCGKTYDRKAFKIRLDNEILDGTYTDFENKQKSLYDEVALSGDDTIQLVSTFDKIYKDTLLNTKVNVLPHWLCTLENKTMIPLSEVKQEKLYYPEGHHWTWDRTSFRDFFNCGGAIRAWQTIFDYKWGRISGMYNYGYETDIFDLYSYGITKVLTNWVNGESGTSI